jgi:uncharacterized RDD family membrane protein YckC
MEGDLSQDLACAFPDRPNVERTIDVATGESVAFAYELAGLGSRFLAVTVDFIIQVAVLIAAVLAFSLLAESGLARTPPLLHKLGDAILAAVFYFGLFMLFFGYFILFEWRWAGRTPGKRLLGIRVVRDGGFAVDFVSSVIRNTIRMIEFFVGFYALSAVCALLSPQNRRLGDMAAGTLVVRDARYERALPLPSRGSRLEDPVVRDLDARERDLIRRYAERRDGLRADARADLAAKIARAIRPKLSASYDHLDDDSLLTFLAENALG